jgi:transposase InsO family protein
MQTQPHLRPRQIRWLMALQEFDFIVEYMEGEFNTFADWLSRRPDYQHSRCSDCNKVINVLRTKDATTLLEFNKFADDLQTEQEGDDFCQQLDEWQDSPKSIPFSLRGYAKLFSKIDSLWKYKGVAPVLPSRDLQVYFLEYFHGRPESGHFGYRKTLESLQQVVYWPGMLNDVRTFIRSCDICQRVNASQDSYGLLHQLQVPDERAQSVSIDFCELSTSKAGFDYLLTITDRFSKLVVAKECHKTISAVDVASLLYREWYLRGYGWPEEIVSDRDPRFTAAIWAAFCNLLGITRTMSTSRHQQTNGQAESTNRILSDALTKVCNHRRDDWVDKLPTILFAYNNSIHSSTGFTPFYLMHGYRPLTFPQFENHSRPSRTLSLQRYELDLESAHENRTTTPATPYNIGDYVLLARDGINWPPFSVQSSQKLLARWLGPFRISQADTTHDNYTLELPSSMRCHNVFHARVLKRYLSPSSDFPHRTADPPPPPVVTEDGEEFEVESILDHKILSSGRIKYLIHWKGYDSAHDTWEPPISKIVLI